MLRAMTAGILCLLTGFFAAQRLSQRVQLLRQWCFVLENLCANCACLRLPPEEIWQMSAGNTQFSQDPEEAKRALAAMHLLKEEKALLSICLETLLDGTQEQQLRQMEHTCGFFEKRLSLAEEKQRQDSKLYGMLGVFGGLCIFLVCV